MIETCVAFYDASVDFESNEKEEDTETNVGSERR